MKLAYPFPLEVRLLYIDCWQCWLCGGNGTQDGGLEIHHICGRVSDSAFNSSCLCKKCHATMGHSQEEEQKLFLITLKYLFNKEYQPVPNDWKFLYENKRLLSDEVLKWCNDNYLREDSQ